MIVPRRLASLTTLILVVCLAVWCPIPRYPAVSSDDAPPGADETFGLDPWLLAEGLTERVVVEIDWVAGCKPGPLTVQGLRDLFAELGPPGIELELSLDDEIPREAWETMREEHDVHDAYTVGAAFVGRHADLADLPLDASSRVERRYVLFVPRDPAGFWGYSATWFVSRGDETRFVRGVVINREPHARYDLLWVSVDRIERMTLIHEFGHQLGLTGNPRHERSHPRHRNHCNSLDCFMAHPTPRVVIRNALPALFNVFPRGYCERCRADIRHAQEIWRRRLAADPGWRDSLVAARDAEALQARIARLVWDKKAERALEEIAAARERGAYDSKLAEQEALALIQLGRLDEALARLPGFSDLDASARWQLGAALIDAGRHEELVALFDREELRRGEDHVFEQSSHMVRAALVGLGRHGEAADLVDELLSRGHHLSFTPAGMQVEQADLLRRAGRVDEALVLVRRGLDERRTRAEWTNAVAAAVLESAGHPDEGIALRREVLERAQQREADAKDDDGRRRAAAELAAAHAFLDEREQALAALERAGPAPADPQAVWQRWLRVQVFARLGDLDRAAELVQDRTAWPPGAFDPCGAEALQPMLADERFADVVGHCPLAAHGDRP